jgi:thioredoxin-dependent peroxiredoxin
MSVRRAGGRRVRGGHFCEKSFTSSGPDCGAVSLAGMRTGDLVPDFELPDQHGEPRRLSQLLADGPVVLFFYPAALTPGCTKEACHFRDLAAEFAAAGAQRVGISADPVDRQREFADRHQFDYPLLADVDGRVAETFGVGRGRLGRRLGAPVKRWTFVIGKDSRVVAVISSELNMDKHADEALAALR